MLGPAGRRREVSPAGRCCCILCEEVRQSVEGAFERTARCLSLREMASGLNWEILIDAPRGIRAFLGESLRSSMTKLYILHGMLTCVTDLWTYQLTNPIISSRTSISTYIIIP
ncbi:hypothetical protein Plhal304r1_c029g0094381 [Plasmopara halstedii]